MKVKMQKLIFQAQFGLLSLPFNKFGHVKVSLTMDLQISFHISGPYRKGGGTGEVGGHQTPPPNHFVEQKNFFQAESENINFLHVNNM